MCVFSSIYKKKKPLYGKLQVADIYGVRMELHVGTVVFEFNCGICGVRVVLWD